jgi:hypothetical protein
MGKECLKLEIFEIVASFVWEGDFIHTNIVLITHY